METVSAKLQSSTTTSFPEISMVEFKTSFSFLFVLNTEESHCGFEI